MDESALRTLIANLEASRSSLHWWLECWTWLVVAGVVFEVVFVIWEYLDELHDFQRGIIHPPERPRKSMFFLGLLGASLVAIGVTGELREGAKIETLETSIRKANNELSLLLSKEAGDAAASAKTARDEADAAVKSASDAMLKSEAAAKLAGKAEGKAEKVGKKAEEISARLEAASRQLSQVEERVRIQGPRWKLLMDGQKAFVEALKPFKGQKVIMVTCAPRQAPWQPQEEYMFELILLNLLVEPAPTRELRAGWAVLTGSSYSCAGWGRGVWVLYSTPVVKAAAEALGSALTKLEISADTTQITGAASEYARQQRKPDDLNALWELVASDPTGIYILTGENPQYFEPKK